MSNSNLANFINGTKTFFSEHSPEILTGAGVVGYITSTVFAVAATPKALTLIEAEKKKQKVDKLNAWGIIRAAWKCYIPTVAMSAISTVCVVSANSIHLKRNAAILAAYTLSDTTFKDYQKKVVEKIGEKKEDAVKDEVAKEKILRQPSSNSEIILTGLGETLCYDSVSGRYFKSDIDKIRKIENNLNRQMRDEMYISLNEFYTEIGLPSIKIGDDLGWNIDKGYIDIQFRAQLSDNEIPCLVLDYSVIPIY